MKPGQKQQDVSKETVSIVTPIGILIVSAIDGAVCSVALTEPGNEATAKADANEPVLRQAARELQEYFAGERKAFTFAMRADGTMFQQCVWAALREIPFGETKSYGEIAAKIDNPKASRAVGMACNRNPIMIAVPCHRVVGAMGALVGYAYGTGIKQRLLDLEQKIYSAQSIIDSHSYA